MYDILSLTDTSQLLMQVLQGKHNPK